MLLNSFFLAQPSEVIIRGIYFLVGPILFREKLVSYLGNAIAAFCLCLIIESLALDQMVKVSQHLV